MSYGTLSMLISHEFSHLFDDQGRKYDADGGRRDGWTAEARARVLVEQPDAHRPFPGVHVDGELTLDENIADLAGLEIGLRTYSLAGGRDDTPVIDGFTPLQRFFLARAQTFRVKRTEASTRARLRRPHAPARYRVNGIFAHSPDFYRAFDVRETDRLYRPPEHRVAFWR